MKRIIIGCEFTGVVRDAFKKEGWDAWSCDLLPTELPGNHIQGDILEVLDMGWDMMIAHPACTYLCNSGVRWLSEEPGRWNKMHDAVEFFNTLKSADIPKKCIENPIPHKFGIGKTYSQIINPWEYGHKEMKPTCLWLDGLPLLIPTDIVGPPPEDKIERRKWQVIHRMSPGPNRGKERSRTYSGIADAFAKQWGGNFKPPQSIFNFTC